MAAGDVPSQLMSTPGRLPSFGSLLRELRRSAGLTQEELADKARVGVRTLRDLETSRTARPQRSTVDLLATALELDAAARKDFVVASRGWPGPTRIPRQRTHAAVLASWRLLTPMEQESLSWLSVFQGRWTLALATALLATRPEQEVADLVDHLVEVGLVSTMPVSAVPVSAVPDEQVPPRFWLRDTVRVVVAERVTRPGELDAARDRHAAVLADLASAVVASADSAGGAWVFLDLAADFEAAVAHLRAGDPDAARDLEAHITTWQAAGAMR